jgi:hypothetical protein
MYVNGSLVALRWCDTQSHEPRFATMRLGWTPRVVSDYCDDCAVTWRAYAAELGGDVVAESLAPSPVVVAKQGVA